MLAANPLNKMDPSVPEQVVGFVATPEILVGVELMVTVIAALGPSQPPDAETALT